MATSYSATELAPLLGKSDRAIAIRANKPGNAWPFFWQTTKGGAEKRFPEATLPQDIRIALARAAALPQTSPNLPQQAALAGTLRATEITQDEAEARTKAQIAKEQALAAFGLLPEEKKAQAYLRRDILAARDAFVKAARMPVKRGSQVFCHEWAAGNIRIGGRDGQSGRDGQGGPEATLSWSTLYRWQAAYDEKGLAGLVDGYRAANKGCTSLLADHQKFLQALLVEHPHITLIKIEQAFSARFDGRTIPHISSIRRYCKAWKKQHASLFLFITNPGAWQNKYMLALGDASEQIERPNQRWEIDSTPADLMLKGGRHTVVAVTDVFTRRSLVLVSKTSKSTAIAALIRWAIIEWGVPEEIKTDNGQDYVSNHIVRIIEDLGITAFLCEPFSPWQKPHVERFIGTFLHGIVELLPGYIGHSVADRKAIESRRSFADRLMKIGGDPVADYKLMEAAEFQEICNRWLKAMYEQDAHGGLDGKTPAEVARAWTRPLRRITDERALDILLHEAAKGGTRTIQKGGVEVEGVFYTAPEMGGNNSRLVRVLLGHDYGTIHLFYADGEEAGQYLCTAVDPARTGHDRAEIAAKAKALENEYFREGRKELKRNSKEQAVEQIHMEILEHRESLIANVVELPKRAVEYTTPALDEAKRAVIEIAEGRKPRAPQPISNEEMAASEKMIAKLQKKTTIRLAMPADEYEAWEMLKREAEDGLELSDPEHRWIAEYELLMSTGKRTGLVKAGWQPYAERAKIARIESGKGL